MLDEEKPHPNAEEFRANRDGSPFHRLDTHLTAAIAEFAPPAPLPPKEKSMSITGIGGAGSTIKQLLEDHKKQMTNLVEGHVAELKDTLNKQRSAVGAFGRMVQTASKETDDFLSDLGQFTNDLGL